MLYKCLSKTSYGHAVFKAQLFIYMSSCREVSVVRNEVSWSPKLRFLRVSTFEALLVRDAHVACTLVLLGRERKFLIPLKFGSRYMDRWVVVSERYL